jgi:hypothetical protein
MPTFSTRPLTWLLVIATAVLDLAIASNRLWTIDLVYVASGFMVGQLLVAAGWMAAGRVHRLARAAVGGIIIFAIAALITVAVSNPGGLTAARWGRIFGTVALICGPASASALVIRIAEKHRSHRSESEVSERLRFPLVEAFGWMIVVAVVSTALRFAVFRSPNNIELLFLLGGSAIGGACYVLLGVQRLHGAARVFLAIAVIAGFLLSCAAVIPRGELSLLFLWAYAYLVVWSFVRWIDRKSAERRMAMTGSHDAGADGSVEAAPVRLIVDADDETPI